MFQLALADFSLSALMSQEFRRRISQLVATKYRLGQVFTAFFIAAIPLFIVELYNTCVYFYSIQKIL